MNNYCKKCRLRDGCMRKCKEAEVYEQGYCDGVSDGYNGAVDVLTPYEQQPKFSVSECEEIAEKLAEFFKPYFEKYKIRKI